MSERAPGPSPTFSLYHILRTMELVGEKPVGRNKLAESLNVGDGAIRTIIHRLSNAGFISTSRGGCVLTSKGLRFMKEYTSVFKKKVELGKSELSLADYNVAILVADCEKKVQSGVEQRDAAVLAGAKGATTMVFQKGRLVFPSADKSAQTGSSKAADRIAGVLKPAEGDVVVIGSAESLAKAHYGALAAAWTLIDACRAYSQ